MRRRGRGSDLVPDGMIRRVISGLTSMRLTLIRSKALNEKEPLMALCCCACWVMETLAHHCENAHDFIAIVHTAEGLVQMAAHAPAPSDAQALQNRQAHESSILSALHKMYETLRQCE